MTKDEALAMALEALHRSDCLGYQANLKAIEAIKEALKEPKPEPVAYLDERNGHLISDTTHPHLYTPLYVSPPPPELTCVCGAVWEDGEMVEAPRWTEWIGLTPDKIWK